MTKYTKSKNSFIDWLVRDKNNNIVIVQLPNIPIGIAGVAWLGMQLFRGGGLYSVLLIIYTVSLLVWAVLEIGWGVTNFRRLLGIVVFGFVVLSLILKYL